MKQAYSWKSSFSCVLKNYQGFVAGKSWPIVLAEIELEQAPEGEIESIKKILETVFVFNQVDNPLQFIQDDGIRLFSLTFQQILKMSNFPFVEKVNVVNKPEDFRKIILEIPTHSFTAKPIKMSVAATIELLELMISTSDPNKIKIYLDSLLKGVRSVSPRGMNGFRLIESAHELGIPFWELSGSIVRFGMGVNSRWFESTLSDITPAISANLAKNKLYTAQLLRTCGLPGSLPIIVNSEADIVRKAKQLGYPVVVKPTDLDGGVGVTAFIESEKELTRAYRIAKSKSVSIEKHFHGNDYRCQVVHQQVLSVTHRKPAGVVGDGVHSVDELVTLVNQDPDRGPPGTALLKYIIWDEESEIWLKKQNLNKLSIPMKDQFVRLKGAANVASGGTIEQVMELAHPDNLSLAIRAARALNLDIAGIDLMIPDIKDSWFESGALICEVNAQPQMAPHLPELVLKMAFPKSGRIPFLILAGSSDSETMHEIKKLIHEKFSGVGWATRGEVSVDGITVGKCSSTFDAGLFLCQSRDVRIGVLHMSDKTLLERGSSVDKADVVLLDSTISREMSVAIEAWAKKLSPCVGYISDRGIKITSEESSTNQIDSHSGFIQHISFLESTYL